MRNAVFQKSLLPTRFMLGLQKLLIKYSNKGVLRANFRDLNTVLNSYFSTPVLASFWHFPALFTLHKIETKKDFIMALYVVFKERRQHLDVCNVNNRKSFI